MGVFWGQFAALEPMNSMQNFQEILQWIAQGKLKQHIYGEYSLDNAHQALQAIMERKVVGKVVITV